MAGTGKKKYSVLTFEYFYMIEFYEKCWLNMISAVVKLMNLLEKMKMLYLDDYLTWGQLIYSL